MAQAVRHSPPTAGVPSSRLGHSMWVSWWTKRGLGSFSRGFSRFPLPQISFHLFSTLISSISFHFISPSDGASGVVGRHPCYSWTYNLGLHRISSLDPTLCWTQVEDIYFLFKSLNWNRKYGIKLNGYRLTNLRFTDDVILFARNHKKTTRHVTRLTTTVKMQV